MCLKAWKVLQGLTSTGCRSDVFTQPMGIQVSTFWRVYKELKWLHVLQLTNKKWRAHNCHFPRRHHISDFHILRKANLLLSCDTYIQTRELAEPGGCLCRAEKVAATRVRGALFTSQQLTGRIERWRSQTSDLPASWTVLHLTGLIMDFTGQDLWVLPHPHPAPHRPHSIWSVSILLNMGEWSAALGLSHLSANQAWLSTPVFMRHIKRTLPLSVTGRSQNSLMTSS